MLASHPTFGVLHHLPALSQGRIAVYHLDRRGEVLHREGCQEQIDFRIEDDLPVAATSSRREAILRSVNTRGEWIAVTCDTGDEPWVESLLEGLMMLATEKDQVESDMISMQSSSLALLEEVAMVGEILPKMAGAQTEEEMVQRAMESLLVAASAQRAVFLRFDSKRDFLRVVAQVRLGEDDLMPTPEPYPFDPFLSRDRSLCWRALDGSGGAVLESAPHPGGLGGEGSPESLAQAQAVAVPVRYGDDETQHDLGVVLIMDKRENTYSDKKKLGSQETKLAASVASMLGSMLGSRLVTELNQEMGLAQAMQRNILPSRAPELAGFEVAGRCENSGAVGGDYFDFLHLPDGRTMVVIADVSGHNLASGMVMVSARSALHLLSQLRSEPAAIFDELAAALYADLSRLERFITAAAVTVDPGQAEVEIANAGHNPTMIYRAGTGTVEELPGADTVLGFLPRPAHELARLKLQPGDVVFLYTDGITEATGASGEMFEEERLKNVLRRACAGSAEEILDAVFGAVGAYADRQGESDDISAVVLKFSGGAG